VWDGASKLNYMLLVARSRTGESVRVCEGVACALVAAGAMRRLDSLPTVRQALDTLKAREADGAAEAAAASATHASSWQVGGACCNCIARSLRGSVGALRRRPSAMYFFGKGCSL